MNKEIYDEVREFVINATINELEEINNMMPWEKSRFYIIQKMTYDVFIQYYRVILPTILFNYIRVNHLIKQ